jgi:hypothetical protein
MPTVMKLLSMSRRFTFPPARSSKLQSGCDVEYNGMVMDKKTDEVRKVAIEFMIRLSEAKWGMLGRLMYGRQQLSNNASKGWENL